MSAAQSGRYFGSVGVLLCLSVLSGCVLDTTGKFGECPEGKLVCTVFDKDYDFNSEQHDYRFKGRCEIKRDDLGSQFGDPMVDFTVRGQYDKKTFEFAEAADFEGRFESSAALTGTSTRDPWIYPAWPVAIKNYAGDPNGLARNFCIDGIPPKYSRVPFSRNIIIYMLSDHERLLLAKAATDAKDTPPPPPPPAPPCPLFYVKNPPAMYMPTPGLVYPEHVEGITVYLTSECGAPNVDYQKSRFQVEFEHFDNGWQPFRDYLVNVSYRAEGGSLASATLPLNATGQWRVRARQALVQKHQTSAHIGDYGAWVNFHVGAPSYTMSQIDLSIVPRVAAPEGRFEAMERTWNATRSRSMGRLSRVPEQDTLRGGTNRPEARSEAND